MKISAKKSIFLLMLIAISLFVSTLSFAEVQKTTLQVTSDPSGADVYVNGIHKGKTPVKIESVSLGKAAIKLTMSNYKDDIKLVELVGTDNSYYRKLVPLQETNEMVELIINSPTRDANVYVNDKLMGTTPFSTKLLTGNYRIRISKAGFEDNIINVMLYKQKTYYVTLKKKIEAPVVVEQIKVSDAKSVQKPVEPIVYSKLEQKVIGKVIKRGYAKSAYTGVFKVSSNLPDSAVYIDGVYAGFAPISVTVSSIDMHDVIVMKSGYYNYEVKKSVDLEDSVEIYAVLVEDINQVGKKGSFYVTSMPGGASVYIDNEYKGVTPLMAKNIIEGKHTIKVTKSGYNDQTFVKYLPMRMTMNIMAYLTTGVKSSSPRYGEISIKSTPSNADVYINSESKGKTPLSVKSLYTGRYDVTLKADGYKDYSVTKYVNSEEIVNVDAKMISLPKKGNEMGSLYVRSIPSGADVYVDDVLKGKTPYTQVNVAPGAYNVKMTKTGYADYVKSVKVESGKTGTIWAEIKKTK